HIGQNVSAQPQPPEHDVAETSDKENTPVVANAKSGGGWLEASLGFEPLSRFRDGGLDDLNRNILTVESAEDKASGGVPLNADRSAPGADEIQRSCLCSLPQTSSSSARDRGGCPCFQS